MTSICVNVENTPINTTAVNYIIHHFPCFVREKAIDNSYLEIDIKCRQEDAKSIEKVLASIV